MQDDNVLVKKADDHRNIFQNSVKNHTSSTYNQLNCNGHTVCSNQTDPNTILTSREQIRARTNVQQYVRAQNKNRLCRNENVLKERYQNSRYNLRCNNPVSV